MIYFLAARQMGLVKLGYTCDVVRRVHQIRSTYIPTVKLKLMSVFEGDKDTEMAYHECLAATRVKGEWFRYDKWMVLAALGLAVPDGGVFKILAIPVKQVCEEELARVNGERKNLSMAPKEPPGFSQAIFDKYFKEQS